MSLLTGAARKKFGRLTVLATLSIMIIRLSSIPVSNSFSPEYFNCGSGQNSWYGIVLDQEGNGLPGVVVSVTTKPFFRPYASALTQTDANGAWGVTLDSPCPVSVDFYWTGIGGSTTTDNRPELLGISSYSNNAQETVNVWWTPQDTQLAYEFPNTNQSTLEIIESKTFTLSDNVRV